MRGRAHGADTAGVLASILRSSSRAGFLELIQQRGIPLTPGPSPSLGRGEPKSSESSEKRKLSSQDSVVLNRRNINNTLGF